MSNSKNPIEFDKIINSNKTKFINEQLRSGLSDDTPESTTTCTPTQHPTTTPRRRKPPSPIKIFQNNLSLEKVGIPTSPAFNHNWCENDNALSPSTSMPSPQPSPQPSPRISSLAFSRENRDSSMNTITPKVSNRDVDHLPPLPPSPTDIGMLCFNQDESFLPKHKHAQYLGSPSPFNKDALMSYMSQFDFSNLRLDNALRKLTSKLFLRAESQQIDRILESFSFKFFSDNPSSVYRNPDIVHAISYSILLLNTDLHIADIATHMSRNQFLKNTLNVIHNQCDNFKDLDADDSSSISSSTNDNSTSTHQPPPLSYYSRKSNIARNGSLSSIKSNLSPPSSSSFSDDKVKKSSSSITINQSYHLHQLDSDLEPLLREIYNSVRLHKILLPLDSTTAGNLSASNHRKKNTNNRQRLPRNMSSTSMSASSLKRGSIRGLSSLLGNEGRSSPTCSLGSVMEKPAPSIGFASNLSQTIIKEQHEESNSLKSSPSEITLAELTLKDEELALMGPPWAKEGFLQRKHYYESQNKRSKDRNWLEVFVVISKGYLKMFTFGDTAGVQGAQSNGGVGGGNWTNNANLVEDVPLAHSISDIMKPGYNRSRPYCFQLILPNGGKYYLQTGTESLLEEWVSTCNYWASRSSKEPLSGGISNMEYGWNTTLSEIEQGTSSTHLKPQKEEDGSSVKSNYSFNRWKQTFRTNADRTFIEEWNSPHLPVVSSSLAEEDQRKALEKCNNNLKKELRIHRQVYDKMLQNYSIKSSNRDKAVNNWNKKTKYLTNEMKKYERYIEELSKAISMRTRNKLTDKVPIMDIGKEKEQEKYVERLERVGSVEEDDDDDDKIEDDEDD
ncbi:hypothetical protein E3P84_03902 [Wallemia ichthyophaga]|nr:hypothetical protein E3P98_00935 [Wallemia ichthyophaga]TIA95112.1 hypothetical protein E3P95_03878 [Wallemia ichthyophaga]TIA95984.1 hypothetical protein E3P94_03863 [Wallemia ichthyophaga]TIB28935.1 hypothetical protein E3P84_03902 [Wallemia ichthyophaga]TIB38632.1 hypothetical protein E3P83_03894 [Wallemia ichthyophaga]